MGRRVAVWTACAVFTLLASCGGGGGGGGGGGNQNEIPDPTGLLTLQVEKLNLDGSEDNNTSPFTVTVRGASAGTRVVLGSGAGLSLAVGDVPLGQGGEVLTDADGTVQGMVTALFAGTWRLEATLPEGDPRVATDGPVSVFVNLVVRFLPDQSTPTGTPGTGGPPTPTPVEAIEVRTIYMEVEPFAIRAATGGTVTVRAFAFDLDNQPLNNVNLLFDFEPKVGILRPIATRTRRIMQGDQILADGVAEVQIVIPPETAPPGEVTVTASTLAVQGSVSFSVVPGNAPRPVSFVLLQTGTTNCGTDAGGTVQLRAVVFDADNNAMEGINVLFLTEVGQIVTLVAQTQKVGNDTVAETILQVPPGTPIRRDAVGNILPYTLTARAGGVVGTGGIFIVPGRNCEPEDLGSGDSPAASILLSAGPSRIRVRGSGSRELSSVIATVLDVDGNRLPNTGVRFFLAPESAADGAILLPSGSAPAGQCSATVDQTCDLNTDCPSGETCVTDPRNQFRVLTDSAGNAAIQLRAGSGLGTVTIGAEVASVAGNEFTQPCSVSFSGQPAGQRCISARRPLVTVTAGLPGRLALAMNSRFVDNNDGTLLTTLSAIVTDASGNLVDDFTPVSFEILPFDQDDDASRRAGIQGASQTNTLPPCDVSRFLPQTGEQVTPQPGDAITCVKFPQNQRGTDIRVRVESLGIETVQQVTLPGAVSTLLLSASPDTVVVTDDQDGTSLLTALVLDDNGNGVANAKLRFLPDRGTVGPDPFGMTDADGVATITLTVPSGTPAGEMTVEAFGAGIPRFGVPTLCDTIDNCVEITVRSTASDRPEGTPNAIVFDGASPSTIGVRASGLIEQSVVSFSVRDRLDTPLSGVPVTFSINGIGGERLVEPAAVTDENGVARATIVSGTRAGPVQITAMIDVDGNQAPDIVAPFTAVNVVGGPPAFNRFSLAHEFANISGRVIFGLENQITAFLNDRFGNPVAAGTAVSFTTNGASIVGVNPTDDSGRASGDLLSEGGVPDNGIVSVLATTRGEEPFVDANGNGVYDLGEIFTDIPEPFIDFNVNGQFNTPEPFEDANSNGHWDAGETFTDQNGNSEFDDHRFERFIDLNSNGLWDQAQGANTWNGNAVIWATLETTFSGGTRVIIEPETFAIPDGGSQTFSLFIGDSDANPIVGGSTVTTRLVGEGATLVGGSFTLADGQTFGSIVPGLNLFSFTVVDAEPGEPANPTSLFVEVTVNSDPEVNGPGGNGSGTVTVEGVLLPAPTGTPAPTPTPTPEPTVTGTQIPTQTPTPTIPPTVTATLPPPATSTHTATITATPIPASMSFVSGLPALIGVRGSGLAEQAVLVFRVTDAFANPIGGVPVEFLLTAVGGESIQPLAAVSDASGQVTTTLTSGTRTTSVRVSGRVAAIPSINAQSTAVSIVGAPPAQNRFSLSPERQNVAGRRSFGIETRVSAFVNDRFGNAVPAGTVVNFITNGASIVDPFSTNSSGIASATLLSEGEVPPSGIVTILGFTRGEEGFLDANGNGRFDAGDTISTDNQPEPFIDFRPFPPADAGCSVPAPSRFCNAQFDPSFPFELFVDAGSLNGLWGAQGTGGVWDNEIFVFGTASITFSGTLVTPVVTPSVFAVPNGGSQSFTITVHDDLVNPLVGDSNIAITANTGTVVGGGITVPDGQSFNQLVDGLTRFNFVLIDGDGTDTDAPAAATITVSVTSDNGAGTFILASGTVD